MKRVLFALAVGLAAAGPLAVEARPQPKYVELFDDLARTVQANFYDPHFHGVNWSEVTQRYRRRLKDVRDDQQFLRLGEDMLAELKSSHVHLRPPGGSAASAVGIGVDFRRIGQDWVVTHVELLSDARRQGIRPGDVLMSPREELGGEMGSIASPRLRTCAGEEKVLAVRREGGFWPPAKPNLRWSKIRPEPGKTIGYIRADRFDDGAAELADQAMADLGQTDGLIIDVRDNSGGNASALRLASYFSEGAFPSVVLLTRPYLERLGRPVTAADALAAPRLDRAYTTDRVLGGLAQHGGVALWTEDVGDKRYAKPVVVLINEETGSAAEGFAWHMRLKTHAHLIGRRTAGALLSGETFDLAYGWKVVVPTAGNWAPDGQNYGDRAVPPHLVTPQSRADLCAGRDPDLDAAMDRLLGRVR